MNAFFPGARSLHLSDVRLDLPRGSSRRTKQRYLCVAALALILGVTVSCLVAAEATAPTVVTGRATNVTATSATLTSIVSPNGAESGAGFEYGRDTTYGTGIGSLAGSGSTEGTYDFQLTIQGLTENTLYHYRAVAGNSAGSSYGEDRTFVAGNNPPIAQHDDFELPPGFGPFVLRVLANDSDVERTPLHVTDATSPAHGTVAIINDGGEISYQLTEPTYIGEDSFTYVVSDGASTDSATVVVHLPLREPILSALFSKGDAVPGAGSPGSNVPADATFDRLGLPSINDAGEVTFRAQIASSEGARAIIFGPRLDDVPAVLITTGDNAPASDGTPTGLTFATFKHPLINDVGAVAFLATLSGEDVNASNDVGIWTNEGGVLRLVARAGDVAPGLSGEGAVFGRFLSVALGDSAYALDEDALAPPAVAFVAQLEAGRGGVTAANDLGLWAYRRGESGSPLRSVLREGTLLDLRPGDAYPGKTVLSFIALQPMPGAAGQGHGVGFSRHNRASDEVLALVKFTDATQAIVEFRIAADISTFTVAETGEVGAPSLKFQSFSVPTQSFDGQNAFIAKFQRDPEEEVGSRAQRAVYVANDLDALHTFRMVSSGDPLPENNDASFARFQTVVNNGHGNYAILASVAGTGINIANDTGIWRDSIDGLRPLIREGSPAPGVENTIFLRFISLAMPDDGRAIFKARVRNESTLERSRGIWFTDESNVLRLLIREGDSIPGRTGSPVQSFSALEYVNGSPTQSRTFNKAGDGIFRARFADGSQALIKAVLP
jgi:hypothetical protein